MLNGVEDEWLEFLNTGITNNYIDNTNNNTNVIDEVSERTIDDVSIVPKCSDIYISTKTKISFLNREIDLNYLFWLLPIKKYHIQEEGIVKKQMKFQSLSKEQLEEILEKTDKYYYYKSDVLCNIDNPNGKIKFKDTRKISIGICRKDILNTRCKIKSAFYNCFVIVFRVKIEDQFKEIHIKIFNTGKLEIPGIKNDQLLAKLYTFP